MRPIPSRSISPEAMVSDSSVDCSARSISSPVRSAIQSIKEVVGDCSDADIVAVLAETHMDPTEAAQRLLAQGAHGSYRSRSEIASALGGDKEGGVRVPGERGGGGELEQEILLATGGGHLVYLEIGNAKLAEVRHIQLEYEISCLDINPIGENPNYSSLAGVGMWTDISVRVLSLPIDINPIGESCLMESRTRFKIHF